MRNRWLAVVTGLVLVAVTACTGGNGGDGGDGGDGGPVTLRYGLWNPDQAPVMEDLAAEFTKANPDVNVEVEVTPFDQYWTVLQTAATGGEAPDVFWLNGPNFQLYASNGVISPIDEQIEADDVDTSVFPETLLELYSYEDQQYALPKDFDTIALWYNKELFDAAGVAHPDESWTWETLRDTARQLTDPAAGRYGIAARLDRQEYYYNTIFQAGGSVISEDGTESGYDDPQTIEGLRFWTDLIADGSSPTLQQMTDTEPIQMFQSGITAMYYGGSWRAPTFNNNEYTRDRVNVAPLPRGEEQAAVIHGLGNAIFSRTDHPEEAWEFVKFLASEEAARIQAESGVVIPSYDGTQSAWVEAIPQYDLQVFLDAVEYSVPMPVSENTSAWQADEVELLTQAWAGNMDVETAAKQLAEAMNADLAEEQE